MSKKCKNNVRLPGGELNAVLNGNTSRGIIFNRRMSLAQWVTINSAFLQSTWPMLYHKCLYRLPLHVLAERRGQRLAAVTFSGPHICREHLLRSLDKLDFWSAESDTAIETATPLSLVERWFCPRVWWVGCISNQWDTLGSRRVTPTAACGNISLQVDGMKGWTAVAWFDAASFYM